jgi:hypothetical protein
MSYIAAGATASGAKATLKDGNRLKALFDANKPAYGGWQMIPGAAPARVLAQSGVDWVLVDCEHGSLDGMLYLWRFFNIVWWLDENELMFGNDWQIVQCMSQSQLLPHWEYLPSLDSREWSHGW